MVKPPAGTGHWDEPPGRLLLAWLIDEPKKSGKLGSLVMLSVLREVGKWVRMDFFS